MRIFFAGATGAIGRRVIPQLVARGDQVTAVVRSAEKREALLKQGVHPVQCDLFDPAAVAQAVEGHPVVINLTTSIPRGARAMLARSWEENSRVRKLVSANLSSAALSRDGERFIQESFAPIYPDGGSGWIDEATILKPVATNRTVLDAERAAERFGQAGGTAVVLRFALLYGEHDTFTDAITGSVKKGWLPIPGRPEAYVSLLHHEDAAQAVMAGLGLPTGHYNVVDNEPMTRRELGLGLAGVLGVKPPRIIPSFLTWIAGSSGKMLLRSERISNRKLKEASGWAPRWRSVVEWARVYGLSTGSPLGTRAGAMLG